MKVIAINGSPKKNGNTNHAISLVLNELEASGIESEVIHVGDKLIRGCLACGMCAKNKDEKCVISGDEINSWIQKMKEADGIIIGSPVYCSAIGGTMKSFLDRAFYVAGANNRLFRHKIGASVVALRRSGGIAAFSQLNNYLHIAEMIIPSSNYWNIIHGAAPGESSQDNEGEQIMRILGQNMAWVLQMKKYSEGIIPEPILEPKVVTNFIR